MSYSDEAGTGSALILAGGRSRRFGSNKAFAEINGKPLIRIIIEQLETAFDAILISAENSDEYKSFEKKVCADLIKDSGPIAGIHSGLLNAGSEYVFVTACDMPRISIPLIKLMRKKIIEKQPDAVVLSREGFLEPFHGFYSRRLIPLIKETAEKDSAGIFSFLKQIRPEIINCSNPEIFFNINTPEDLYHIKRR